MMINGSPLTMFAKQTKLLSDYDDMRMAWDWRGANALRPCLHCTNVFKKAGDLCNMPGVEDYMDEDKVEPQPTDMSRPGGAHVDDDARRFMYTVQYKRKADKITQEPLAHMRWCFETRHQDLTHLRTIDAWSSMVLRGIDASLIEVRRKAP